MPDAAALLALGDRPGASTVQRDDALLACFYPGLSEDDAAALTVQARETRLLDAWEQCFGGDLEAQAACPSCGARLDVTLPLASLRQGAAGAPAEAMRSPTGDDLRAIAHCPDVDSAREMLLDRCRLSAGDAAADLAAVARANPQADVSVALSCALCGHGWEAMFEAGAFVWARVERIGATLMQQVHALATAYHWDEDTILTMPERRRARYLALLQTDGDAWAGAAP